MTKKDAKKKSENKPVSGPDSLKGEVVEQKKEEQKELRFCKDCRGYDKSTEREFHRKVGPRNDKGERTEIVEIRAICMNPKAASYRHLVMSEYSKRQCPVWEKGVYERPTKPEKQKPSKKKKAKKDETKDDSNEIVEKVEQALQEGAETATVSSKGGIKTTPRAKVFEKHGKKRFVLVQQ